MTKKVKIHVGDFTVSTIGFLIGELAEQELQADSLSAKMNAELDAVRARYEEKLQNLRGNINIRREALEQWAELRKELFTEKRSMDFERGTIGFRLGTPKLKLLAKRTWDHIRANLINAGPHGYTRTEITVAKDLLIADREKLGDKGLSEIGVKVVQEDSFFCDIKKDEPADSVHSV